MKLKANHKSRSNSTSAYLENLQRENLENHNRKLGLNILDGIFEQKNQQPNFILETNNQEVLEAYFKMSSKKFNQK